MKVYLEGRLVPQEMWERGKRSVLGYYGIGWMDLLNNCHSVSAGWGCKEQVGQLNLNRQYILLIDRMDGRIVSRSTSRYV